MASGYTDLESGVYLARKYILSAGGTTHLVAQWVGYVTVCSRVLVPLHACPQKWIDIADIAHRKLTPTCLAQLNRAPAVWIFTQT